MKNGTAIPLDFPDWLSPMVVKEVRQGLRGWLFVSLFGLLHGALLVWAVTVGEAHSRSAIRENDTFFWVILAIGLGVIVSRGMSALHGERHDNTLELLQLTRLSAWRIVAGKWTALMVQTGLFLTSLLPYALLRYYFGTLEVSADARQLIFTVGIGVVFAALAIYLSCLKRWLAWTVWIGIFAFWIGTIEAFQYKGSWLLLGYLLFQGSVITALFLALGASSFASVSENLTVRKRLLGLTLLLPVLVALVLDEARHPVDFITPFMIAFLVLALTTGDAVASPNATTPAAVNGFERRGTPGRFAALVFAKNRASALIYTGCVWLFLEGAVMWTMGIQEKNFTDKFFRALLAFGGLPSIIFMATGLAYLVPQRLLVRGFGFRFWLYAGLLVGFGVVCLVIRGNVDFAMRPLWESISLGSPIGVFYQMGMASDMTTPGFRHALVALIVHWGLALALLLFPMLREMKNLRRLLRGEHLDSPP